MKMKRIYFHKIISPVSYTDNFRESESYFCNLIDKLRPLWYNYYNLGSLYAYRRKYLKKYPR